MAEYAGLEIRIGGDTTKLNKALKASTKAAAELQREIKMVTTAMQMDPANLQLVSTRIKLTADRMEALRAKIQLTETAMEQLGEKNVQFGKFNGTVKELAAQTHNVAMQAKLADERYNDVVSTIATLYEHFNKVARNAAVDRIAEKLGSTREAVKLANASAEEFEQTLRRFNVPPATIKELEQLRNMQFHFEGRTGELDKMLEKMQQLGIFTDDDVAAVKTLKGQFDSALSTKAARDLADQFQQLGVRIERDKAEVEGLSTSIRELDTHSKVSMDVGFKGTKEQIDSIDRAIKTLDEDMKQANAVLRMDPTNLDAAKRAFDDMNQKAELLNKREELLRQNLDRLNTPGLQQAAQEHQNVAEWVEQARVAAQGARAAYAEQSASLTNLNTAAKKTSDTMAVLKERINAYEGGFSGHDAFARMSEQVDNARTHVDKLLAEWDKMLKADYESGGALDGMMPESVLERYRMLEATVQKTNAELEKWHKFNDWEFKGLDEASDDAKRLKTELGELEQNASKAVEAFFTFADENETVLNMARGIESAKQELKELEQQLKTIDDIKVATPEEYEKWIEELNKLEAEYPELTAEIKKQRQEVKRLEAAQKSAEDELDLANQTQEMREYTREIEKNSAAKKENADAFKGAENRGILSPSNIKSIGMTLYSTLTPAITSVGYAMVTASDNIDTAYRNMRKTVDGTEQDFQRLYDAAVAFSNTHVTSAAELLEIEAIGGELGIAVDNLQMFAESVASIADSTNLSAEEAATALGHLANIMKINPDDYSGFADALVRLGNNGASTEEEIVNVAQRIGSMGAIIGMSTPDVLAWASTIAATGQKSEAAGTAISKTMSFMETAVAAAGGTMEVSMESVGDAIANNSDQLVVFASMAGMSADEFVEAWSSDPEGTFEQLSVLIDGAKGSLQKIADVAGMTADDFAQLWESTPTEALEAFIKGLISIEDAGGSADATLVNLGITSVRQKQAIEGLMQTVGLLDDNLTMSGHAWDGVSDQWGQAGDAANEAAKKAEGFSGQMQILKNMAQGALASLGEGAVPIMKQMAGMLSDLTTWFEGLSVESKKAAIELGAFGVIVGPALTMLSTGLTAKDNILSWLRETNSAMAQVAKAAKHGGKAMVTSLGEGKTMIESLKMSMMALGAEAGPVMASLFTSALYVGAIAGVAALVSEFIKARREMELNERATKGLRDAIDGIAQATGDYESTLPPLERSVSELSTAVDDLRQHQADLATEIDKANTEYSNTAGAAGYYAQTIEDLLNKSDRSEAETDRLRVAIEKLNDTCGTSYALNDYGELIDTQTGKVVDNTAAIWDNVEARRAQATIDYYSDAYDAAVANMLEAKDLMDELEAKRKDLESSEFYGMELWQVDDDDLAAFTEWNAEWRANEQAIADATRSYDLASQAVEDLEAKISNANELLSANERAQKEAADAAEAAARRESTVADDVTGNMKRLSDVVSDDSVFNNMVGTLEALTVSAEELGDVDMNKFAGSFNGSIEDVAGALEEGGVYLTTFRTAMEEAGVSSEQLSTITADAFQTLYESCGSNITRTALALTHMSTVMATVDGQQVAFYVGDNGTIIDTEGRVLDLEDDLAEIPDEVLVEIYGDDTEALEAKREAKRELDELDGDTATVVINAQDNTGGILSNIISRIRAIKNAAATIPVGGGTQATGGMNNVPVIPRHATGYIATGPTLTNQGWIGEDGVEAVANWATGGAVVPLTNTKYMLPIADAIADGMAKRGAGGPTYNLYINGAHVNDNAQISEQFVELMLTLARKEDMNRGY